jgi:NAD(P)-dependent dehydrogenase (short-subunit alcohol dehydrogenase family)
VTADISFAGRVVVISGAGKGMGREHALLLASRGAAIVVDDIDAPAADEVTTLIRDRGGKAVASHETVATRAGGQAIIQTAIDEFGTVDVVVHNAGYVDFENFEDLTEAQITKMVNTHLLGGYWLTQPAWPIMKAKNYGRVVLVSSGSGIMGHHGLADYCGAKAGLYGLMTALAFEGEPFGIRTNAIFPTASTTIMDETFAKIPEFQKWSFGESFEPYSDLMNQTPRFLPTVAHYCSEVCANLLRRRQRLGGDRFRLPQPGEYQVSPATNSSARKLLHPHDSDGFYQRKRRNDEVRCTIGCLAVATMCWHIAAEPWRLHRERFSYWIVLSDNDICELAVASLQGTQS